MYKNKHTEDTSNGIGVTGVQRDIIFIEFLDCLWSGLNGTPEYGNTRSDLDDRLCHTLTL